MNPRRIEPGAQGLQAQGLSLPGYGRDLEVRPYPLAVRGSDVLHSLVGEGVSSFLGRMTVTKAAESRLH